MRLLQIEGDILPINVVTYVHGLGASIRCFVVPGASRQAMHDALPTVLPGNGGLWMFVGVFEPFNRNVFYQTTSEEEVSALLAEPRLLLTFGSERWSGVYSMELLPPSSDGGLELSCSEFNQWMRQTMSTLHGVDAPEPVDFSAVYEVGDLASDIEQFLIEQEEDDDNDQTEQ